MTRPDMRQKVLGVPLSKDFSKNDEGALFVRGYFTSDNTDELGDIITRGATERAIPKYRQWSNIRYMHMPKPVGKVVRIGTTDGLEWNEVEIKVIDPQAVFEVEQGLLSALSVGILIRIEDIDFNDNGGWTINDYQLAEISLVDHPANYDAFLKDLPVEQGLRVLARSHGTTNLVQQFRRIYSEELNTSDWEVLKEADMPEEVVETQPVQEEQEDKVINEPEADAEAQPELEVEKGAEDEEPEEVEAEEAAQEEPEAEEPEAEQEEPEVEEPAGEADESAEPEEAQFSFEEMVLDLQTNTLTTLKSLTEAVEGLVKAFQAFTDATQSEVAAEASLAGEQADDEVVSVEPEVDGAETEDEEAQLAAPANRTVALPETDLSHDEEEDAQPPAPRDLRSVLSRMLIK